MKRNDLEKTFEYLWNNPPAPFNSLYDAEKQKKIKTNEAFIKKALDEYHKQLKHVPNDEYYDLMDAREAELLSVRLD